MSVADTTPQKDSKKLRRITRACDYCHKRSIRCRFPGEEDSARCQNCIDFDQACRFDRVVKRRGAKPRSQALASAEEGTIAGGQDQYYDDDCTTPSISSATPIREWAPRHVASQPVILDLVEIYFEIVYPIFPFFHKPTFMRQVAQGDHNNDKFCFAVTMAMCALVSARIKDGALYNSRWNIQELTQTRSELFYAAAVRECGNVGALTRVDFDLLRTCALLSITAVQYGRFREFQTHIGKYHTLVAMDGLHDEQSWPADIGIVETEERRRLFWSMYSLDIFSAIVWNGMVRCREQQSNVSYPTELDDDFFDDGGYRTENAPSTESPVIIGPNPGHSAIDVRSSSWLSGWNFNTDLWRTMEHIIGDFRDKRRHKHSFLSEMFGEHSTVLTSTIKDSIMARYNNIPQCFKETQEITCDPYLDRFGFQAANITATLQMLRMIIFSTSGVPVEDRCKIASEVVDAFMRIPVQYLQAISSPLLHHLCGIGSILSSVFEEPLSESGYLQVRVVLLALAQLLENLDQGAHSTASADKLRQVVGRFDRHRERQRGGIDNTFENRRGQVQPATALAYVVRDKSASDSTNTNSGSNNTPSGEASSSSLNSDRVMANRNFLPFTPAKAPEDWPSSFDFMHFPET